MPVFIEFSRCIGTYSSAKFELIKNKNKYIVGVFHSHQRHPAIFSTVDVDLHPSPNLWHLIISLRNKEEPQIKAFMLQENIPVELDIIKENR